MVTPATARALMVVFSPVELDDAALARVTSTSSSRAREYCGGVETFAGIA
jgi:DNA/RNA-binding domain of Phe-tRNA-synthetase-like protein